MPGQLVTEKSYSDAFVQDTRIVPCAELPKHLGLFDICGSLPYICHFNCIGYKYLVSDIDHAIDSHPSRFKNYTLVELVMSTDEYFNTLILDTILV